MRTVTVTDLISKIRTRSDTQKTLFVTDAEIVGFIDAAYCKMYDDIVSKYENYFVKPDAITVTSSTALYDVPADFYKLLKVERLRTGSSINDAQARFSPIFPINFQETGRRQSTYWPVVNEVRYILQNEQIRFDPPSNFIARIWYIPAPEVIASNSSINCRAGWENFIIETACVMVANKEQLDATPHQQIADREQMRILRMAQNYDAGLPKTIVDVEAMSADPYYNY